MINKLNFKINNQITAPEVRVVVDETGEALGVMPIQEALQKARNMGLDLVEIAPTIKPPVAKIVSYDKFRYKKEKELKKQIVNQKTGGMKQIRIGAKEARHDLETKIRKIEEFINDGHKIEITLVLRGREKYNRDWAQYKINEFLQIIPFPYKVLAQPKFGGRGLITQISK
ncbi:MAG: translation initiation factor IF-3 [Patescibacteria group bacterium]|nr:translation initiation factor IF-3 [Patescibacteria group bacterium]